MCVAPRVGARVEIYLWVKCQRSVREVAPRVGARVEIDNVRIELTQGAVAPRVGARVEMNTV